MTVGELKKELDALPDRMLVVMSSDGEGNSFSPLAELSTGNYDADTTWSGDFFSAEHGEDGGEPEAVCLWPVN